MLQGFTYRTPLSLWLFVITAATLAVTAFVTICFHTAGTARRTPAQSLKTA